MRREGIHCVVENREEGNAFETIANVFWRDCIENGLKRSSLSNEEKLCVLNRLIDNLCCHSGENPL